MLAIGQEWLDPERALRRLIAAAVFACGSLSSANAPAAVSYYFNWYCARCGSIGVSSNGREGPFESPSACEGARASMAAGLNMRGCGMDCFNPQLCRTEGVPEPPAVPRRPSAPPALILPSPVPGYGVSGRRRAEEAEQEREEAEREARARGGKESPSTASPSLAPRWRNAFSRYEVRRSAQAIEIVLAETCAAADCSRKTYPNRPVFRGRFEGDRLIGVVPVYSVIESEQNGTRCTTPAGDFPIEGRISGDGQRITWGKAEFPAQQGCRTAALSLGTWKREP